jgi:hypothetical protein
MDDDLYEALGRRAAMDNRSISQEVITIIKRFLAQPADRASLNPDEEALKLSGSWSDERCAGDIAKAIRAARRSDRFKGGF